MPLINSASKPAFVSNLKAELEAGKPKNQSLAIAYSQQRKNRADGGGLSDANAGSPEPMPDTGPSDANLNYPRDFSQEHPRIRDYVYGLGQVYGQLWDDMTSPARKAFGGSASSENWLAHSALRNMQQVHSGPINSAIAGRTDHIPLNVASGSYVVPADIVSGLGQGNTASGHQIINKMFHSGPYDGALGRAPRAAKLGTPRLNLSPKAPTMNFAAGGAVPIMAAGGEHVLTPAQVAALGGGDVKHGHEILDAWVKHERNKINKEQKKLPPPAKD